MSQVKIEDLWGLIYEDIDSIIAGVALRIGDDFEFNGDTELSKPNQLRFLLVKEIYNVLCVKEHKDIDPNTASQFLCGYIEKGKKGNKGKYQRVLKTIQSEGSIISSQLDHFEKAIEASIQVKAYLRETNTTVYKIPVAQIENRAIKDNQWQEDIRRRFLFKLVELVNCYVNSLNGDLTTEIKRSLPNANKQNVLSICACLLIEAFAELQHDIEFSEKEKNVIGENLKKIRSQISSYFDGETSGVSRTQKKSDAAISANTNKEDTEILVFLTRKIHLAHGGSLEDTEALKTLYDKLAEITQVIRAIKSDMWNHYNKAMKAQMIVDQYNLDQTMDKELEAAISIT